MGSKAGRVRAIVRAKVWSFIASVMALMLVYICREHEEGEKKIQGLDECCDGGSYGMGRGGEAMAKRKGKVVRDEGKQDAPCAIAGFPPAFFSAVFACSLIFWICVLRFGFTGAGGGGVVFDAWPGVEGRA